MAASASDYTIVRFSSCTLAEEGRGQALEELHERGLLPTRFMRYSNAASRVDLVNRTMPGLRILTASYMNVLREGVRQDGELLYLCMTLSGTTVGSRGGREMVLSAGDAVLMTNEEATWTMTSPSSSKIAGIRVPRSAIAPLVPKLGNVTMRRITGDTSGLRLLRKYLDVVADDEALAAPGSQRVIVSHFYDLVALVLGASSDAKVLAADRTVARCGSRRSRPTSSPTSMTAL